MVTLCRHFDTTDTDFSRSESKKMLFFVGITQFSKNLSGVKVFNARC